MVSNKRSNETTFADVLVAVFSAAEISFGIVEMNCFQKAKPDDAIQLVDRGFEAFGRGNIVSGGESVACIETDADAGLIHDKIDDGP